MSVSLNQSKGVEGWNYTFEVSPASLSFDAAGGTKQVSVTSYRCQTVNGIENGVQENVGYSSSVSGEGFSSNGTAVIAEENTNPFARTGTVSYTQNNSGKTVSVSLYQDFSTVTLKISYSAVQHIHAPFYWEAAGASGELNPNEEYVSITVELGGELLLEPNCADCEIHFLDDYGQIPVGAGGDFPSSVDFKNYRYSEDDGVQSGTIELGYYMAETIKLTIR